MSPPEVGAGGPGLLVQAFVYMLGLEAAHPCDRERERNSASADEIRRVHAAMQDSSRTADECREAMESLSELVCGYYETLDAYDLAARHHEMRMTAKAAGDEDLHRIHCCAETRLREHDQAKIDATHVRASYNDNHLQELAHVCPTSECPSLSRAARCVGLSTSPTARPPPPVIIPVKSSLSVADRQSKPEPPGDDPEAGSSRRMGLRKAGAVTAALGGALGFTSLSLAFVGYGFEQRIEGAVDYSARYERLYASGKKANLYAFTTSGLALSMIIIATPLIVCSFPEVCTEGRLTRRRSPRVRLDGSSVRVHF